MTVEFIYFLIGLGVAFASDDEKINIIGRTYVFLFTIALWPAILGYDFIKFLGKQK